MCAIINFEGFWEMFHRESARCLALIFLYHRWVMLCLTCKNNLCGGGVTFTRIRVYAVMYDCLEIWNKASTAWFVFCPRVWNLMLGEGFMRMYEMEQMAAFQRNVFLDKYGYLLKPSSKLNNSFFFCVPDWVDTHVNNPNCFHNCLKGNIGDI